MPKLFGRDIPPIAIIGLAVIGAWAFASALGGPDTTTTTKRAGPPPKKDTVNTDWNDSDFKATFASLPKATVPVDAFRPLVGGKTENLDLKNQSIDNFSYSGMATIGTKAQGLLENSTTGEGDFVETGQHWHQTWLVVSLSADAISLRNTDTGEDTVLKAGANEKSVNANAAAPRVAAGGNMPFNPAMVGPIGGPDITVQSDQGGGATINMGGGGGGGRRRGGRGRGGGGGGGGNGYGGPQGG